MAISVIIGTFNSEEHLPEVIGAVSDFDEILVYDMGSTDSSVETARALGCKVMELGLPAEDPSLPHNVAIRAARYEWVLMLEPTEIVTPQLRTHLYNFIQHPGEIRGLLLPRRNFLMNRERANAYPDFQLRFFAKEDTLWNANPEELPKIAGKIGRVPARRKELAMIHIPSSISATIEHLGDEYAILNPEPQEISLFKIFKATVGAFFEDYILKGKFRYGASGYIDSVNTAVASYFILGKQHESKVMADFINRIVRPIEDMHRDDRRQKGSDRYE